MERYINQTAGALLSVAGRQERYLPARERGAGAGQHAVIYYR
nr:MAG TPA: hypothetical protein [Caudoviricetes sp.]